MAFNGRYYDVRFRYDSLAFKGKLENYFFFIKQNKININLGSEENINWYLMNSVGTPNAFNPTAVLKLTNGVVNRVQDDPFVEHQFADQLNGAR